MGEHESPPPLETEWDKGRHEDRVVFVLEVKVCEKNLMGVRMVYSHHDYQSEEDRELAGSLISRGEEQIAWALLQEAARRECYLELLILLQQDPEYLVRYQGAAEDDKREMEIEVGARMASVVSRTAQKMAPVTAREILDMLVQGSESVSARGVVR